MHILRIIDSSGSVVLENTYDKAGRVLQLSLQDGKTYHFDYAPHQQEKSGHVDVTDPKGKVTRVIFGVPLESGQAYYRIEKQDRLSLR
jgi:hypothetical protein